MGSLLSSDHGIRRSQAVPGQAPDPSSGPDRAGVAPQPFDWLLGDIGGTWSRLELHRGSGSGAGPYDKRSNDQFDSLEAVVRSFCAKHEACPLDAGFAFAGPIEGDEVSLTNRDWRFSVQGMRASLGLRSLRIVNDFVANAAGVARLAPQYRHHLAGVDRQGVIEQAALVIGPGTGLGVATLLGAPESGVPRVVPSEGGHMSLASTDEETDALLKAARGRWARVSWERLLGGSGLAWMARQAGAPIAEGDAAAAVRLARDGDSVCAGVIVRYCRLLGALCGDLCLAVRAGDGVFLAGGVLDGMAELFDVAAFRDGFEAKGRFSGWLRAIPTYRVDAPRLAMDGLLGIMRGEVEAPGQLARQ